jgi:hypothetical protein
MRTLDYALAWILFALGLAGILFIEARHPPGAVLDTPFLWILAAMFNLLRLSNGYQVRWLKSFCVAANVVVLVAEVVRFKMFGPLQLIQGVPLLGEVIFSITRRKDASIA